MEMDCWVGDKLFLNAGDGTCEAIELAELLRLGLMAKLDGQEERAVTAAAEFMQERTKEQMKATRHESIVDAVMQDRALFEMAARQPISADRVLRYLNATMDQRPDATGHLGI